MKVAYHPFRTYVKKQATYSDEAALEGLSRDERARAEENLYSFVSMCPDLRTNTLYLGTTHRTGDILVAFDLKTKQFKSCGYDKSGLFAKGDVKIHKGLWLDPEQNALYFGIATLMPFSEAVDSPGGKFIRFDIKSEKFTNLGNPTPGQHYQGTLYDGRRHMMYAFTNMGAFVAYNFEQKKVIRFTVTETSPHNGCVDPEGRVWGLCDINEQRFFRYDPDKDKFEFPGKPLPHALEASNIMYRGAGPVDALINGNDGHLYCATPLGEIFKLNYTTGESQYLCKPFSDRRLPGLALGGDGWLYASGGNSNVSMLARYHLESGRCEYLGPIQHADGTFMHYVHEIVVIGKTVYAVETDNPNRSGYLWSCEVD